MDLIDSAQAQEEEMRARHLAVIRDAANGSEIPAVGRCYNCESSVPSGARFCDADCRKDWEDRRRSEIRRGREA
jgi:hypothetical protein